MGMSDKKTTSDQTQTQATSSTTTPNVPSWISDPAQAMAGTIGKLQAQGPGAFTPTTSDLENQVTDAAAHYTPASDYSDARGAYGSIPNVEGQSLLTNLDQYYNPFKEQITNPVMADFDVNAGKTRAAQAAAAAGPGHAFQGSRYGIQEGATEGELARARSATEGGLLKDMFTESTGLSSTDAQRRQSAQESNAASAVARAQGLAGIDTSQNAQQLAALGLQSNIGQRATEEQQIQQQYPLTFAAQQEGLLSGLNPSLFTGSSSTGTGTSTSHGTETVSDPMAQLSSLIGAASGFVPGGQMAGLFKGVTGGATNFLTGGRG